MIMEDVSKLVNFAIFTNYSGQFNSFLCCPMNVLCMLKYLYDCLKKAGSLILCHDPYVKFWEELSLEVGQDLMHYLDNSII